MGGKLDFAGMNAAYAKFFGTPDQPNKPAPSTFQVAALVAAGALVEIEVQAARSKPLAATVFTDQQAEAGRIAYAKSCASCHMPDLSGSNEMPPLAGTAFMSTWGTRSTKELYDYMATSMPYGLPSLSRVAYESISAYILQSNGALAGSQALRASDAVSIGSLMPSRLTTP
jgi:mono/diheme cytochrome c family protein